MNEIIYSLKEFFASRSIPAYIVGGYLRDNLLGIEVQDFDLVAMSDPIELGKELANRLNTFNIDKTTKNYVFAKRKFC